MGLEVHEDNAGELIGGNANNIIAWLRGNKPGAPKIFLSAHFDTVEPTAGLEIEERDGVFYSASDTILGADDKGGMAPAIEDSPMSDGKRSPLTETSASFSPAPKRSASRSAEALKIEDLGLDFGYVLDTGPPVGTFVTHTATHDKLDITIIGKPAHAGKDPRKGHQRHPGCINRDSRHEVGSDRAGNSSQHRHYHRRQRGQRGLRRSPNEGGSAQHEAWKSWIARSATLIQRFEEAGREWGARVKIDHERHYDAYSVPSDSKVVTVAQAASRELGFEPTLRTTLGGSDANVYNTKGVSCIVMATGMDKIHTHDELISRKDLVDTAKLALQTILRAAD